MTFLSLLRGHGRKIFLARHFLLFLFGAGAGKSAVHADVIDYMVLWCKWEAKTSPSRAVAEEGDFELDYIEMRVTESLQSV